MPKRKPARSRRKPGSRPPATPMAAPATRVTAPPVAVATPGVAPSASDPTRERPAGRSSARDYSYVQREITRILVLASAVLITIVVLSFFLP